MTPDEKTLFLAVQGPLDYPTTALGRLSRNVRILRFDIASERVTGEFVYYFDEVCAFLGQPAGCAVIPGEMKVSSLVAVNATTFSLTNAPTRQPRSTAWTCRLPRTFSAARGTASRHHQMRRRLPSKPCRIRPAPGLAVLPKTLVVDLSALGLPNKIEGISLVRPDVLAVANDNDFGMIDIATFDARTGKMTSDTMVKSKIFYVQLPARVN